MNGRVLGGFFAALIVAIVMAACGGSSCSGITCNDGWCSPAQNTQGACSSHGGIKSSTRSSLIAPSGLIAQ